MNGLGRYDEAAAAALEASRSTPELHVAAWALSELSEAATRTGDTELASGAVERLGAQTEATDSDWGLGVLARARALLSEGEAAERDYIDNGTRTHNAQQALLRVRRRVDPVTPPELKDVVAIWAATALGLSALDLRKMPRLPPAQEKRPAARKQSRGKRASVPSWDEIMFGARRPE